MYRIIRVTVAFWLEFLSCLRMGGLLRKLRAPVSDRRTLIKGRVVLVRFYLKQVVSIGIKWHLPQLNI